METPVFRERREQQHPVQQIQEKISKTGKLNMPKCILGKTKLDILGYTVNTEGVKQSKERVRAITDFPKFKKMKQLRQFLDVPKKCTALQFRHLNHIAQCNSAIRHVTGCNNVVTDTLSRVNEVKQTINYQVLQRVQESDDEVKEAHKHLLLIIDKVCLPDTGTEVVCDISTGNVRPFVLKSHRRNVFQTLHTLAHPGAHATTALITERFVWPGVKADCKRWTKECMACQGAKITQHVNASTLVRTFMENWIMRFGPSRRETSDQGRQFKTCLFNKLLKLVGPEHLKFTAYHPQAHGMVECLHRQRKTVMRTHGTNSWTDALPLIFLGIRAALKDDFGASAAQMLYDEGLRLPGKFLVAAQHRY
ncbi:hypothetical protein KM043_013193 [Ampulex compressa]|nr:hypothetical protein KM043_013193 [Ampulex compressa]